MNPRRWEQIRVAFDEIVELGEAERATRLAVLGTRDPELREAVESLLGADVQADARLAPVESPFGIAPDAGGSNARRLAPELEARLQAGLGTAYRVEREMGGGGMSYVYVAEETAFRRRVVVKVLRPELAEAVSARRFEREIQLAARLQHPHIVPLLRAGEIDAPDASRDGADERLLYYTMPFVEGESLRDRLRRDGELPIGETVRILRDVASALSYAHRHGVVHRDIKPGNVLLSEGGAVVTDFGIARALSAAPESADAPETTITQLGMALGTPCYMAPEQASGDPAADHRLDLYGLGVMAYEMLAGRPPFDARSAHQLMVAHATEVPEPVARRRPGTPPGLAALVMRCLEKLPADRPQSAEEVLRELEEVGSTAATGRRRWLGGRRATLGGALVLAAAMAAYVAARALGVGPAGSLLAAGTLAERDRILLADFRNSTGDSVLGRVATEAFRIDFDQSPAVTLVPPAQVQEALVRMRRRADTTLDEALARELAVRDGIKAVVAGEIGSAGASYSLSARLLSAADGTTLAAFRETAADSTEILRALDRLSRRLRERIGESLRSIRAQPPLEKLTTASLPALRRYVQGERAYNVEGNFPRSLALLEEAIALDSTFAAAHLSLGVLLSNEGRDAARMGRAIRKGYEYRDRLSERERRLAVAIHHTFIEGDRERAVAAYRSVLDDDPSDQSAINNLGVLYIDLRRPDSALAYSERALALDSTNSLYWLNHASNLGWAGRDQEARATLDRATALFPGHGNLPLYRAAFLASQGDYGGAEREIQALRAARRGSEFWRVTTSAELANLAAVRGRLREAEAHQRDVLAALAAEQRHGGYVVATASLALFDVLLRDEPAAGLRKVDDALARYPLSRLAPQDRPYRHLAFFYAVAGRPDRARALLAGWDSVAADAPKDRVYELDTYGPRGMVALAERRLDDAIAQFRAADIGVCEPCALPMLGRAYDLAGQTDSAIAVYERYVSSPWMFRTVITVVTLNRLDATQLAPILRRLGDLYEARGDRERAAHYYARFAELWKDADPDLQPQVTEARRRLARLTGERAP